MAEMAVFDVVEAILSRSAAEDLIQWKRVCKSWYSLISSPSFVRLHLKMTSNNRHLRIMMPTYWKAVEKISNESLCEYNSWKVVGSSNGLVCFSRLYKDALTVINNPWTREVTKVPMSPLVPEKVESNLLTLSFGYDSYTDDYKVVMAIQQTDLNESSLVQVLSLKSNTWKLIGQFKYRICNNKPGILCNGALHWFALDFHFDSEDPDRVILSFDLLREEFTVIPEPNDSRYEYDESSFTALGMLEDQLCIFSYNICNDNDFPRDIWVMRSYSVEESWELLSNDCEIKYEVVHYMNMLDRISPKETTMSFFCNYNNKCLSRAWKYISAHKFVPSLVSPVHTGRADPPKNNKSVQVWSVSCAQVAEGECPHLQARIRNFIKTTEHVEKIYRREFGDQAQNLYLHEDGETEMKIEDRGSHTIAVCGGRG